MRGIVVRLTALLFASLALGPTGPAWASSQVVNDDTDDGDDCQRAPIDFGDAPEGVAAYPGVIGHFPTCRAGTPPGDQTSVCPPISSAPATTGFVEHVHTMANPSYWLGCGPVGAAPRGIDSEGDGKTNSTGAAFSACAATQSVDCIEAAFGMNFGQDECYGGEDSGVASSIVLAPCSPNRITFDTYNCGADREAYLNILVDMNHDGDWNDNLPCPAAGCAYEWAVVNALIQLPSGCTSITSPTFLVGPNEGGAWLRISLSNDPVPPDFPWNGSAGLATQTLINGETEDYPVAIRTTPPPCPDYEDWGDAPELVQAYPGVIGQFPTCGAAGPPGSVQGTPACNPISTPPGPTGFVRHLSTANDNFKTWLGCGDPLQNTLGIDAEPDGKVNDNGGPISACFNGINIDCLEGFGLTFGQDECYGDGVDAGLDAPLLRFKTCQSASFMYRTYHCGPNPTEGYLNVLVDMNQDGDWNDFFVCTGGPVPVCAFEWAVKNQPIVIGAGCQGASTPSFPVGPLAGAGWMRVTVTPTPVADDFPWNGSAGATGDGFFIGGETEDYPVVIQPNTVGVNQGPSGDQFWMAPVAPNPARDGITVTFSLPQAAEVSLSAFDIAGRKLADLTQGILSAGTHQVTWNFRDSGGRPIAAGYYLVRLRVGERTLVQRGMRIP